MWKNREPIISFIGPMCKAKLYIEFSRYIDFISGWFIWRACLLKRLHEL